MNKTWSRLLGGISLALMLTACGFTLRGTTPLPFDSLYLAINENTAFGSRLKRALQATSPGTVMVSSPKDAQAIYTQIRNDRGIREVSLNAVGRVEQYELTVNYAFRVTDQKGNAFLADTSFSASREVPYDDNFQQAKDDEFQRIYEDLEIGLVARIVRRMTSPQVRDAFERQQRGEVSDTAADPIAPSLDTRQNGSPDIWRRETGMPGGIRR